jgi:hypothetical protein
MEIIGAIAAAKATLLGKGGLGIFGYGNDSVFGFHATVIQPLPQFAWRLKSGINLRKEINDDYSHDSC